MAKILVTKGYLDNLLKEEEYIDFIQISDSPYDYAELVFKFDDKFFMAIMEKELIHGETIDDLRVVYVWRDLEDNKVSCYEVYPEEEIVVNWWYV